MTYSRSARIRNLFLGIAIALLGTFLLAPAQGVSAAVKCGKADPYRVVKIVKGGTNCREAKKVVRKYSRTAKVMRGWKRRPGNATESGGLESIFVKKSNGARVKVYFLGEPSVG